MGGFRQKGRKRPQISGFVRSESLAQVIVNPTQTPSLFLVSMGILITVIPLLSEEKYKVFSGFPRFPTWPKNLSKLSPVSVSFPFIRKARSTSSSRFFTVFLPCYFPVTRAVTVRYRTRPLSVYLPFYSGLFGVSWSRNNPQNTDNS